ncbi:MAG: adventurous gliding motility protein CglE [Myxococcota bacterium]|nr:adventurous gliding motility protein CglE [Myxococcota bacterium]
MFRIPRTFLIAAFFVAGPALAQTQDKEAVTFEEVERGLYVGASAGPFFILNAPAPDGVARPLAPGQSGAVEVGFDFGEVVSVGVFLQGTANRAGQDYRGLGDGIQSGDFSALIPGAAIKVNLVGFADAQQTRRTFLFLRAGAGYAMFAPVQLLPDPDILVFGGAGVEYYTRLRHFSIGLELAGSFLVGSGAVGISLMPNLRYAF